MNNLYTMSWQLPQGGFSNLRKEAQNADLEGGSLVNQPGMDLREFNRQVRAIEMDIQTAKDLTRKLERSHESSKTALQVDEVKAIRTRMANDVTLIKNSAKLVKRKIEELKRDNMINRKFPNCQENSATDRHRLNITVNLGNKLNELVTDFQTLEKKMAKDHREVVERRIFTVTGESVDSSLVDNLIESGKSDEIFHLAVQQQGRGKALDVIAEMQERHDAVQDLKKSLTELHELFLDMATLVTSQGELLDDIEGNIGEAVVKNEEANKTLVTAVELKRNTRKWICYGSIIIIVILLIILIPVIISVTNAAKAAAKA